MCQDYINIRSVVKGSGAGGGGGYIGRRNKKISGCLGCPRNYEDTFPLSIFTYDFTLLASEKVVGLSSPSEKEGGGR